MNNSTASGERLPNDPNNLSFWDTASKKFINQNDGNVKIAAGNVSDLSVLMQTELPALLAKSGDFEIDGLSKSAIAAAGDLDFQKSKILTNAISQTFVSALSSTNLGPYVEMTPDRWAEMLADKTTQIGGMTHAQRFDAYIATLTGDAKTRFDLASRNTIKGMEQLANSLPLKTLAKFGLMFGALGLLAAGHESAEAAERGDTEGAKRIIFEYAAEAAASEIAGKVAGTIALIGVAAAAVVGVAVSAPVAGALVLGAALLGGYFGGEAVKPWLDYLKDRDNSGRMDALEAMSNLIFGASYSTLQAPPQPLLHNLLALQSGFISSALGPQTSREDIVLQAKVNIAWRYALKELNAFVVEGVDYALYNTDGGLDLYDPSTGQGSMTEAYMADRAAMLTWKIRFDLGMRDDNDSEHDGPKSYTEDWDTNAVQGNWDFVDMGMQLPGGDPLTLAIDGLGLSLHDHQVVFGSNAGESIDGAGDSDRLYGGGGDDTIKGLEGDDYLEGGTGSDTYQFSGSFGKDTVVDADGLGKIQIDGVVLSGGKKLSDKLWESDDDKKFRYVLQDNGDLIIQRSSGTDRITIKGWQNNQLGIKLDEDPKPPKPAPVGPLFFNGDQRAKLVGTETQLEMTPERPTYGTYAWSETTWANDGTLTNGVSEVNFADVINASSAGANGSVIKGFGGNDALSGSAGRDDIFGDEGDDLIAGGAGSDNIRGGDGNDFINSSATRNVQARLRRDGSAGTDCAGNKVLVFAPKSIATCARSMRARGRFLSRNRSYQRNLQNTNHAPCQRYSTANATARSTTCQE